MATTRTRPRKPTRQINRKKKPSVAIVGSGRVGTAIGIALARAGYQINVVAALHAAHARRAANLIGKNIAAASAANLERPSRRQFNLLIQSDVILIATPDDAVVTVAEQLSRMFRDRQTPKPKRSSKSRVALHTSGALSSEALRALKEEGFAVGSIHPLVAISDAVVGAGWLKRAFFSLEGAARAVQQGRKIVKDLGGQSFTVSRDRKALYHAAALMASPNVAALFDIAVEMMSRCGLTNARARRVLLPLVASTLENLSKQDPQRALTGTFKRGDIETVRKHIAAIESMGLYAALEAYVLLGRHSLKLVKLDRKRIKEIERLLNATVSRPSK